MPKKKKVGSKKRMREKKNLIKKMAIQKRGAGLLK
jgi:hypothetical protein